MWGTGSKGLWVGGRGVGGRDGIGGTCGSGGRRIMVVGWQ